MTEPTEIFLEVKTTNRTARGTWEVYGTFKRLADGSIITGAFSGSNFQSEPAAIKAGLGNIGVAMLNLNNANSVEKFNTARFEIRFTKVVVA